MVADQLVFDHTHEFQNWGEVEQSVAQAIAGSSVPFDPATVSNTHDFLGLICARCPLPESAGKGYWGTICISWTDVEVEIFDDRYELYQFTDGHTDIEYFDRVLGSDVPADLLNKLPPIAKLSD